MNSKFTIELTSVDVGQTIIIHAKSKSEAKNIDIELTEGEDEKYCAEIPLHISLRFFGGGLIVRNNRTKANKWGKEETKENLVPKSVANPIKSGDDFNISIYIDVDKFCVMIDGIPFCTFKHRKDFKQIKRLNVTNDVEKIYQVEHEKTKQVWPEQTDTVFRLSVPRKFKDGDILIINGVVRGSDTGSFMLNVFDGELKRQYLHITTNLGFKSFKLNSQNVNHTLQEEIIVKSSPFPLEVNFPFTVAIIIKDQSFSFAINGNVLASLPFKETVERIFSTMNGIEIISKDGTKVEVKRFEHLEKGKNCGTYEGLVESVIFKM